MRFFKVRDSSISKKFIIIITIIYSFLIIFSALSFNYLIQSNGSLLKSLLMKNNKNNLLVKVKNVIDRLGFENSKSLRDTKRIIKKYCTERDGYYYALIYRNTSDENYFKIVDKIGISDKLSIDVDLKSQVRSDRNINYIKKAMLKAIVEEDIYKKNNFYWQNIYYPYNINKKKYVLQFMVSASKIVQIIQDYNRSIKKIRFIIIVICFILIIGVVIVSMVFINNYSLLIKNLSLYMGKAAQGNLDVNIKESDDSELNELAHSFNMLIEELKDKSLKQPAGNIFKTAVTSFKENRLDDAVVLFTALTILRPDSFGSFFNLGVTYAKLKKYELSINMFNKAHELNPDYVLTKEYIERVKRLTYSGKTKS